MTDTVEEAARLLDDAGYRIFYEDEGLLFEDPTVFGAIRVFSTVETILNTWEEVQDAFVDQWSREIRTASSKRWNAYLCLLSSAPVSDTQESRLLEIEEDLRSMRKIAAGALTTKADIRRALYPLLPVQSLASMEEEPVSARLQRRSSLDAELIEAFEQGWKASRIADLLLEGDRA